MQGRSQRAAAKHFGVSRDMVAALLREPAEGTERRYTRRKAREAPARERIRPHIEGWLKENEGLQRWAPKQRWTAHRMWVRIASRKNVTRAGLLPHEISYRGCLITVVSGRLRRPCVSTQTRSGPTA